MPTNFTSGPKVAIELRRAERAGVRRAGDELPERVELGERGARRIVVMRRAVVDVGRDPDDVADALASLMNDSRPAISSSRPSGAPPSPLATASKSGAVGDHQAERHVAGDDLPRRG